MHFLGINMKSRKYRKEDHMKFAWEDSLLLGVSEMDSEHKELIEKANVLFEALGDPSKSSEVILDTLDYLAIYVVKHFNSEEKLQKQYNYPGYKEHHQIHEDFKQEVALLVKDIKDNGLSITKKIAVNKMLIKWLQNHIGVEDKKLAAHIINTKK